MKQYYIVKGKKVWASDRSKFARSEFGDRGLLVRQHNIDGKKVPIQFYRPKQWFCTKKVAIAYSQFLIEKQALELVKRAEKLRRSKVTLINTTNGEQRLY